jgi:hypothetical protein
VCSDPSGRANILSRDIGYTGSVRFTDAKLGEEKLEVSCACR